MSHDEPQASHPTAHTSHPTVKVLDPDAHVANPAFDQSDPHGVHSGETHGHVIVSSRMLLSVLVILLVFTILTVFLSRAEGWIAEAFNTTLPNWLNVAVAMSIATVKAILVAMFFMQLKYDNKLYALIMGFCMLGVGIFIGATSQDLFTRDRIYRFKEGEIVAGGTGGDGLERRDKSPAADFDPYDPRTGKRKKDSINEPIWLFAKNDPTKPISAEALARIEASHHHHDEPVNSASRSRPMVGPRIFADPGHAGDGHGPEGEH